MTPTKTDAAGTGQAISRQFPEEWPAVPFWSVYHRVKRASTGREELLSVYRDHGVVRKSDRDDNFNQPSEDLSLYQLVHSGDLVINKMKAWQGSVAVSPLDGIVSPAYFVFERASSSDPRYMHYLLRSAPFVAAYRAASKGIRPNQWDLDPDVLRTFPLCLPPLDLQRRIGVSLDRETGEIDAFIRDQEELIGLLEERRAATISHAVTKGLKRQAPTQQSGISWIGQIPTSWKIRKLGQLFGTIGSGTTPSRDNAMYYGEGTAWVTTSELREGSISSTSEQVTPAAFREFSALRIFPKGALLIAMYGATVGRLAFLAIEAATNQACCALAAPRGYSTRFAFYVLLAAREHLLQLADGAGQPNISQDKVRRLQVPVPPVDEQNDIAEWLDRETAELDATIADARQAIALSRERRSALISAAVTGKIDVREHVGV